MLRQPLRRGAQPQEGQGGRRDRDGLRDVAGRAHFRPRATQRKPGDKPEERPREAGPPGFITGRSCSRHEHPRAGGRPPDRYQHTPRQEGGLPTDISIPVEQNGEVPPGTTPPGGSLPLGSAGGVLADYGTPSLPPAGAHDGALLAQAEPAATPAQEGAVEVPVQVDPTVTPGSLELLAPASTAPADEKTDGEKQEDAGPSTETKGVGNLSNLAEQVSGRGFQIYMLLLTIALGVVIYLTLKRASREGKAR